MPRGLGRGLSALIPGAPASELPPQRASMPVTPATLAVSLERIHANPLQPRHAFAPEELEQLAASIRTHGILQPLVVSVRSDGEYELIAGERRLRAAKLAGLTEIPIVVRDGATDDRAKLELALIENIQRQDLNPIERALAYRQLREEFGLTQEEVATRVGVSRSSVAHALRLLALPADMQGALRAGTLTEGHAKVLAGIADAKEQRAWFERIQEQHLPVAAIATARQRTAHPQRTSSGTSVRDPNLRAKELALQQRLGAKVRIVPAPQGGGGSIAITYADPEELHGILDAILRS